jgi:hypothetical protein
MSAARRWYDTASRGDAPTSRDERLVDAADLVAYLTLYFTSRLLRRAIELCFLVWLCIFWGGP